MVADTARRAHVADLWRSVDKTPLQWLWHAHLAADLIATEALDWSASVGVESAAKCLAKGDARPADEAALHRGHRDTRRTRRGVRHGKRSREGQGGSDDGEHGKQSEETKMKNLRAGNTLEHPVYLVMTTPKNPLDTFTFYGGEP